MFLATCRFTAGITCIMLYAILDTNSSFIGKTQIIELKIFREFVFNLVCVAFFWREKNTRGYPLKIVVEKVVRGNAVQMFPNFPAKMLYLLL